jgi:PAS domain S-box-containing protein
MLKHDSKSKLKNKLREQAEKILSAKPKKHGPVDSTEIDAVIHELQVHEIELEMQNDALRQAQVEIERSQSKYSDFYDFAPVGFLTLDEKGLILELNFTAAQLLGDGREFLKGKPLSLLVPSDDQDTLYLHRREVLGLGGRHTCDLVLKKKDGALFHGHLESMAVKSDGHLVIRSVLTDITERKEGEKALVESEERLRQALLLSHSFVFEWDLVIDRIVRCENSKAVLGVSVHDIGDDTGQSFFQRLHPDDYESFMRMLEGLKPSDDTYHIEYGLARYDGAKVVFEEIGQAHFDNTGKFHRLVGTVTDITERKEKERQLCALQDELQLVANATPVVLTRLSRDLRYIFVNEAFVRMFGRPREEIIGRPIVEIMGKEGFETIRPYVERVLQGESVEYETEIPYQGIGSRFMHVEYEPERNAEGDVVGWIASVQDISERKKAEEIAEHLASFPQLNPNPVIEVDASGEITFFNQACQTILENLGMNRGDIKAFLPKGLGAVIKDWDKNNAITFYREVLIGDRVFDETVHLVPQFSVVRIYGRDITERKRVEAALKKAHDELEIRIQERTYQLSEAYETLQVEMDERAKVEDQLRQSQKMEAIGTLAGGIAHDFNNMLAAILGFTEMALEDLPDRPDVERNLQNVSRAAMRARDLVKQILTFSRKAGHERNPLSLTPLVKETVQLLRASIPSTIEIRFTATATSDTVLAAPIEMQQILMNLATNASLAMQEKGGTMEVSLTDIDFEPDSPVFGADVSPGEYVQLVVKDTGTGMGPDVMKRVFEPFFTTREVGKGTGMGLAVVYGIVKDLQGTVTVESELGAGSTFSVLLPKVKTDAQAEAVRPVEAPGGNERILFVDDEEMLVEWGRATLEKLGYKVTAITESQEALKTFSMDPSLFDLVITDHAMPQMAGAHLAKEFLNVRRDIPIILCTGHSDNISPESSREIGVKEFLMKPVSKQELAEAVRRVLDGKDQRVK